ncbi:MAG: hypothetical protein WCJ07_15390, partial [Verrucomicrobiota bacterium]
ELDFGRAEGEDVAVAKPGVGLRLFVDGDKGVRDGFYREAFSFLDFQNQVMVPDAFIIHLQFITRRPSDAKWKTAGDVYVARRFTGKNAKLNHQNARRVTSI